jgi:hypothetical protein
MQKETMLASFLQRYMLGKFSFSKPDLLGLDNNVQQYRVKKIQLGSAD